MVHTHWTPSKSNGVTIVAARRRNAANQPLFGRLARPMSRRRRISLAVTGAITGVALLALRALFYVPPAVVSESAVCAADAPRLERGQALKVLVWNAQFAAGRHLFFYDGGSVVHVDRSDVDGTLVRIRDVVRDIDPDVILWQEIDRDSDRTHRIDQHAWLVKELGYPCHTSTPYHRVRYVPHPPEQHMGRVDMHLSVFSRFQIGRATRYQLPQLKEPVHRRLFNLRRALFDVRLPLAGGGELALLDTHLSAFSRGDGTLREQIDLLQEHASRLDEQGIPWLLAGDFNSLPPGFDKTTLDARSQEWYAESETPLAPLFERFASSLPADAYAADVPRWGTYAPLDHAGPDRTLDYVFHSGVQQTAFRVLTDRFDISDHAPLVIELQVP